MILGKFLTSLYLKFFICKMVIIIIGMLHRIVMMIKQVHIHKALKIVLDVVNFQ